MAIKPGSFSLFSKLYFSWTFRMMFHREHVPHFPQPMGVLHTFSSVYVCGCAWVCMCACVCPHACKCIFGCSSAVLSEGMHTSLSSLLFPSVCRLEASIRSDCSGTLHLISCVGSLMSRTVFSFFCQSSQGWDSIHVFLSLDFCVCFDKTQIYLLAKKVLYQLVYPL